MVANASTWAGLRLLGTLSTKYFKLINNLLLFRFEFIMGIFRLSIRHIIFKHYKILNCIDLYLKPIIN